LFQPADDIALIQISQRHAARRSQANDLLI
jgi:hypothetical protein